MTVRPPAVAGRFYPGDARTLAATVDRLLDAGRDGGPCPKALIVPHAGYPYSGPTAGVAYARLLPARDRIRRVVLLGPPHRVPVQGVAVPGVDAFDTPLGAVPIDDEARRTVLALPHAYVDDTPHVHEHSLEVQLPFLQRTLEEFRILPLLVHDAPEPVAAVLDALWGGPETVFVVSSDLSHYLDYDTAAVVDGRTAAAIVACDETAIASDDACGAAPVRGLLVAARRRGLPARLLDLRSSGDTAGDRDAVVGYGAFAFGAASVQ